MTNVAIKKRPLFLLRPLYMWILFYLVLFGGVFAYVNSWYRNHNENQLPSGHIELEMSKTAYQVGETVEFTVRNHFPTTVYVTNHCPQEPLSVYRWEEEKWVELHDIAQGGESTCTSQERNVAIPTENSRTYNFSNWPNLFKEPGVYRIALVVDHYTEIPFQDFVILKPADVVEVMEEPVYRQVPTPTTAVVPIVAPVVVPEVVEEEYEEEDEYEDEEEDEHEDEDEDEEEYKEQEYDHR
jgi:hypothetical protein